MMELFVFAILLTATVTDAKQSQLEGPENTLTFVGSTVTLKCSSPSRNCNGIDWQKYVSGASPITVSKNSRLLNVVDRDRYSVDNSSGCDLVIRNVQLTDAGRFICSAIISSSQTTKTAHLIILIGHQSKCSTNGSQDNTAEGDRVRLTCEVTYNDTKRASMVWKGVTNVLAAVKNGTNISRFHIVTASAPEIPSFTCATSFALETNDSGVAIVGLATNNPVTSCETPVIKVMYSVRNVTLSPPLSNYSSGSVITCTATGRPLPTCKWQEMKNGSTWTDAHNQNGCKFTTPSVSSKWYRCVAMNDVKGKSYIATSDVIMVNNTDSDYNDSPSPLTMNTIFFGLPLLAWVAGGSGSVFLLLIVLLVICCCCRACPCYKCCHSENDPNDEIGKADGKSLDTYIYSTANPTKNVRPKAQPRPAAALPSSAPTKRPPVPPPPMAMERTDNRKAGHKNHKAKSNAKYLDLEE